MGDRWAALFADLAAELDAAEAAETDAEIRDRTRRELARVPLAGRLVAALGAEVTVTTRAGATSGTLADAGPGWLLVGDTLVAEAAVTSIQGLGPYADAPGAVRRALTIGYALRALARRRVPVAITLTDGLSLDGTLDRVGADHAELAVHPPGEPRRPDNVTGTRTIPFAAIATVRAR
ncbi:MAG: hypothetical protein QOE45_986 [Frankiaceae bacterium]|jgi:hypothetical protein|nr:hypothetical protein [Frankiaceae bacterium]